MGDELHLACFLPPSVVISFFRLNATRGRLCSSSLKILKCPAAFQAKSSDAAAQQLAYLIGATSLIS